MFVCAIDDENTNRPSLEATRQAVEKWLDEHAPGYPTYTLCEDGEDGWAFWVAPQDTTSYVRKDLSIQWMGTEWPELWDYNGETGQWSEKAETH